jgi:membrane associated rhomboid family serine protease
MAKRKFLKSIKLVSLLIFIIWGIWFVDFLNDTIGLLPNINSFGVIPRTLPGLIGIFLAPFLHSGLYHLISNTIPLMILCFLVAYFYHKTVKDTILIITLLGGSLLWAFGRQGNHIGSSILIFGFAAFLISSGIFRKKAIPVILAILVGVIYGSSLLWGLIPQFGPVSWEGHLAGAVSGVFASWYGRRK